MHHGAGLRRILTHKEVPEDDQQKLLSMLISDHSKAVLSAPDRAILDYARKLTLTPADMSADDVSKLRTQGFDDLAIHDICTITAYFNFVNRMADGLGVELEDHMLR